jgi:hypothetical protein
MFTFILEFRGGTYISQTNSNVLSKAIIDWAEKLQSVNIKYLGLRGKAEVLYKLNEAEPIPLSGLINAWFLSFSISQGFITVNIVKTAI